MTSGHGTTPLKANPEKLSPPSATNLSTCDVFITPACIQALYKLPNTSDIYSAAGPRADNSLGIFEEGDYYAQEDLDLFFANFTPSIPKGTSPIAAFIDGAEAPINLEDAGGESDLDFELAYPIIHPQTITLYQTDDEFYATNPNSTSTGGFNTFLDALDGSYCSYVDPIDPSYPDSNGYKGKLQCGIYKPTNVISVSYGGQEADLPAAYQQRQCNEFLKLGLQGHSIFFASGDDGVAGPPGDPSDNGCLGTNATIFNPAWPNSCPYITNVGATKINPNMTVNDPEAAVVDPAGHPYRRAFSSGGGFSNIYPRPSYQRDAVKEYFNKHDPGYNAYRGNASFGIRGGIYNRLGRGYVNLLILLI
jgi:tripeptidyl-peptidase-1